MISHSKKVGIWSRAAVQYLHEAPNIQPHYGSLGLDRHSVLDRREPQTPEVQRLNCFFASEIICISIMPLPELGSVPVEQAANALHMQANS